METQNTGRATRAKKESDSKVRSRRIVLTSASAILEKWSFGTKFRNFTHHFLRQLNVKQSIRIGGFDIVVDGYCHRIPLLQLPLLHRQSTIRKFAILLAINRLCIWQCAVWALWNSLPVACMHAFIRAFICAFVQHVVHLQAHLFIWAWDLPHRAQRIDEAFPGECHHRGLPQSVFICIGRATNT